MYLKRPVQSAILATNKLLTSFKTHWLTQEIKTNKTAFHLKWVYFTAIILKVITLEVCLMQKDHCPNADTPKYKLFHQYRWCCSLSFFDAKTPKTISVMNMLLWFHSNNIGTTKNGCYWCSVFYTAGRFQSSSILKSWYLSNGPRNYSTLLVIFCCSSDCVSFSSTSLTISHQCSIVSLHSFVSHLRHNTVIHLKAYILDYI